MDNQKEPVLAIETSGMTTELALLEGDKLLASAFNGRKFAHSEVINILFDAILKSANVKPDEIGYIALSIGPGFFTALRVGLSFAKAFSFVHDTKIVAINTLDALAFEVEPKAGRRAISAIDAQKGEVYYAVYESDGEKWHRKSDYLIDKPQKIAGEADFFVGSGAIKHDLKPRPYHDPMVPSAKWIGILALDAIEKGKFENPEVLEPFYLRLPDAVVNRMKKLKGQDLK